MNEELPVNMDEGPMSRLPICPDVLVKPRTTLLSLAVVVFCSLGFSALVVAQPQKSTDLPESKKNVSQEVPFFEISEEAFAFLHDPKEYYGPGREAMALAYSELRFVWRTTMRPVFEQLGYSRSEISTNGTSWLTFFFDSGRSVDFCG